jgi:hypothetical protein
MRERARSHRSMTTRGLRLKRLENSRGGGRAVFHAELRINPLQVLRDRPRTYRKDGRGVVVRLAAGHPAHTSIAAA